MPLYLVPHRPTAAVAPPGLRIAFSPGPLASATPTGGRLRLLPEPASQVARSMPDNLVSIADYRLRQSGPPPAPAPTRWNGRTRLWLLGGVAAGLPLLVRGLSMLRPL